MSKFERLRRAAGLTQAELADMAGVKQSTVSAWESGIAIPRPGTLVKVATTLGVTVDELLRGGE